MPFSGNSGRITDPRKLPMDTTRPLATAMANFLLDENDEAVVAICRSLESQYLAPRFDWDYRVDHSGLGHTIFVTATTKDGRHKRESQTSYYRLEKCKNDEDMGAYVLRDLVYIYLISNETLCQHWLYEDREGFDLLEQTLHVMLQTVLHESNIDAMIEEQTKKQKELKKAREKA